MNKIIVLVLVIMTNISINVPTRFKTLFKQKERINIYMGGAGSAKSQSIGRRVLIGNLQGETWLCTRKVARTLRFSVFKMLCDIINDANENMSKYFTINKTDMTITSKAGKPIILLGLDDPEKVKSIAGIDKIWAEEANELQYADFKQLNLRLRGKTGFPKQIYLSFNPISDLHWLKTELWDDKRRENVYRHKSTFLDNPFVDDDYIRELEDLKNLDPFFYKIYALGEWGHITNSQVFRNFEIVKKIPVEMHLSNLRNGLDFGYDHAQALVRTGMLDGNLYVIREWYTKGLYNREFIDMVEETEFEKDYPIMAESANPDKIAEWNDHNFKCYAVKKGPDSLHLGIQWIRNFKKIYIHENCVNTIKEFTNFRYRETKDGQIIHNKYVELKDDTIAAIRYGNEDFFLEYGGSPRTIKRSRVGA